MAGIEVIGIVLGAIPLLISGLEHYADGADTIRRAFRAGREFRILKQKLDDENLLFRNTITILLEECVDIETQKDLMKDVDGTIWKDMKVRDALENRLRDSYCSYISHVGKIQASLDKFNERLGITAQGQYPFEINNKSFRQAYDRLRFAMKKEKYLDLIKDIKDQNTFLDKVSQQSKALETGRSRRRVPSFERARSSASSIFESLRRGLHVSCVTAHKASICLTSSIPESTRSTPRHSRDTSGIDDTFRVVLHHDHGLTQPPLLWSLEETEIRLLDSITTATVVPFISPSVDRPRKKKVGFQDSTPKITAPPPPAATALEILDLCQSIQTFPTSQCDICLGYMDCMSSKRRHELYHPKQRLLGHAAFSVITLSSILDHKASTYRRISGRDARKLAVPLATGMLRLHSTPWLQSSWTQQDIMLVCQNDKILAEYPFISKDMPATGAQSAAPKALQGLAASVIKDQMLFTLGIVLIELCMKQSIDNLHIPSELNADSSKHDLSDFQTAVRLLETNAISDEFGERWSEIVYRCIHCNLYSTSKRSLENDAYRKAFYDAIVLKLEEEHRQMFGLE